MANTSGRSERSTRGTILSNTVANGVAQVASIAASFIFLPFLVSAFGLAGYGVFMLSASVTNYALLLDLGVGSTVTRMIADAREHEDSGRLATIVGSGIAFYGLVGVVGALLMSGVALAAGALFEVSAEQAVLLRTLLFIGAAFQLWYWPATTARHALAGYERYDLLARASLAQTVGMLGAVILVLIRGWGPVHLATLNVFVSIGTSVVVFIALAKVLDRDSRLGVSRTVLREMLRTGLPIFAVQIAALINRQSTDRLVIGIFIGPAAVAIYEIAAKLSLLVTQLSDLVVSAILPVAARLNARAHHESLRQLFLRGSKYVSILLAPIVVVLAAVAGPFIDAWFGPGFSESHAIAQILILSQLFVPLYLIGDPILIGKNRYAKWLPGSSSLALLNLVLSVILVQRFGVAGVAIGTLIATLVELPVYVNMVLRELKAPLARWVQAAVWPVYPLLVVPVGIAVLGAQSPLSDSFAGIATIAVVALSAYWGASAFACFSSGERRDLAEMVRGTFRAAPPTGRAS